MLNDNQNNGTGWKARLSSLDYFSDDTFDRAAAWDKLHNRLTEKPARKKFGWYWAAACLVLIAAVGVFTTNNRQQPLVKQTIKTITPLPAIKHGTVKQPAVAIKRNADFSVEIKTPPAKKVAQINPQKSNNEVLHDTVTNKNLTVANNDLPMVPPPFGTKDTVPVAKVNTAKVKNTYRVVHLNELIKPAEAARFARIEKHSLPLKFNAIKYHPEMPVVSAAQSMVTIRLSTQN